MTRPVPHPSGPAHHRWSDTPTYQAAHWRIKVRRGSASQHACVDCSRPALDWAYDGQDPEELTGASSTCSNLRFSLKPQHYQPKCRRCHLRGDAARRRERVA
jgi:hypothetical protein